MKEKREQWAAEYDNALKKKNVEKLQRIYREIYEAAEAGDSEALNMLAYVENAEKNNKVRVGRLAAKAADAGSSVGARNAARIFQRGTCALQDLGKARKYLDMAAKGKNRKAMLTRVWNLLGLEKDYEYDQDAKKAYLQLKEYIKEYAPNEENDAESEIVLQSFFVCGNSSGINMEQEVLPEAWKEFLDQRNPETEFVKQVKVHSFESAGKYFEAAKIYLELKTKYDIEQVCRLFRNEYFETNPKQRQFLDEALSRIRDDENTSEDIRTYLYKWYGVQYYEGKLMEQDYVKAYVYFRKTMKFEPADKDKKQNQDILTSILAGYLSDSQGTAEEFYEKVLAEGCYEAAVQLAQIYRWRGNLELAKQYALKGAEYAKDSILKKAGKTIAKEIETNMELQKREMEEAKEAMEKHMSKYIEISAEGYMELLKLSEKENIYAGLQAHDLFYSEKPEIVEVSLGMPFVIAIAVIAVMYDYTDYIPYVLEILQYKGVLEEVKKYIEDKEEKAEAGKEKRVDWEMLETLLPLWRLVL